MGRWIFCTLLTPKATGLGKLDGQVLSSVSIVWNGLITCGGCTTGVVKINHTRILLRVWVAQIWGISDVWEPWIVFVDSMLILLSVMKCICPILKSEAKRMFRSSDLTNKDWSCPLVGTTCHRISDGAVFFYPTAWSLGFCLRHGTQ
jgi:hypothetical protein